MLGSETNPVQVQSLIFDIFSQLRIVNTRVIERATSATVLNTDALCSVLRFEVLTAVETPMFVFRVVKPSRLAGGHHNIRRNVLPPSSELEHCKSTWRYNPEEQHRLLLSRNTATVFTGWIFFGS